MINTAGFVQQLQPSTPIDRRRLIEEAAQRQALQIPRPQTRADCLQEARPCPWVGCRHHLLLEVAIAKPRKGRPDARPPSLRLNSRERTSGRRKGLSYRSAEQTVRRWIDDAVDLLFVLPHTCALDFVDDHGWNEMQHARMVGHTLGVSKQRILVEVEEAQQHARREGARRGVLDVTDALDV